MTWVDQAYRRKASIAICEKAKAVNVRPHVCVFVASVRRIFSDTVPNDERCKYVAIYCLNLFPYIPFGMYVCHWMVILLLSLRTVTAVACDVFIEFYDKNFSLFNFVGWDSPNISFPVWVWVCYPNFICKHSQAAKKGLNHVFPSIQKRKSRKIGSIEACI